MEQHFYLDPLYGEKAYEEEKVFSEYIVKLLYDEKLRFVSGRTEFYPKHPLVVGCTYDFKITYYPEEMSLKSGAIVKYSIPRTWTQPQNEDNTKPGYVEVKRKSGTHTKVWFTNNGNLQWWICVQILDKDELQDGFVEVNYSGATIQRFPQNEFENWRNSMRTIVELNGEGDYSVVKKEKTEKPIIISAPSSRFNVAAPAVVHKGEKIKLKFSTLDYCDNRAFPYEDMEVFISELCKPFKPLNLISVGSENKGYGEIEVEPNEYNENIRLLVSDRKDKLKGKTPNIIVEDRPEVMNVYFGDIHAKTNLTDGLKTPMEYYEHARDVALLDFAAIADHNAEESSYIEGPFRTRMSSKQYHKIQEACERYNEDGKFVTIQAFEQNYIKDYPGHRNIYFRDKSPGVFQGETLDELYNFLDGHDALIIPHHHIIWNTKVHLDNQKYSKVIEMYSMHCTSEVKDTELNNIISTPSKSETGESARELLNKGYRVGFIAASDNHNGAPGLSARPSRFTNLTYSGGLAAVLAPKLTREDIFDGLNNRRCYATTGARIYLDFTLNDNLMGSEIKASINEKIRYEIRVGGTDDIASIELVMSDKVETLYKYDGKDYVVLKGELKFAKEHEWAYIKVTQIDRHMAWSSPIWIDRI